MFIGILTVSDRAATGEYEDHSGPLIKQILLSRTEWQVVKMSVVADDLEIIRSTLEDWCRLGLNLILTTGGTGFGPRDVTPEATRLVIEREAPGIVEAIRLESLRVTQHAMLSRAVSGIRERTLIINLPGSPRAVRENLDVVLPVLPHALELLAGVSGANDKHRTA